MEFLIALGVYILSMVGALICEEKMYKYYDLAEEEENVEVEQAPVDRQSRKQLQMYDLKAVRR